MSLTRVRLVRQTYEVLRGVLAKIIDLPSLDVQGFNVINIT